MPTLERPGVTLHYEERGGGPPLLLVAGIASDSLSWLPVATPLAARFRTLMPDNRGVGRTRPQDAPCSIDAMDDDCAALLRHAGIERATVLGHSMGGFVAQRLARRHPGLVGRLVLVATATGASERDRARFDAMAASLEAGEDRARWLARLFELVFTARFRNDPSKIDAVMAWSLDYPYAQSARGFRRQVDAMVAYDGTDDAAAIAVPTLVVAGREDPLFPVERCEAFARSLRTAGFAVIENAAHAVHTEQPAAFVDAIVRFAAAA